MPDQQNNQKSQPSATADPRLHTRLGIPAAIWVEPSAEQWFWVRHFGRIFAPSPAQDRGFARWFGRFFVVPSTNVTNFSLQFQSYLNDIFHTTFIARAVHFTCMPLITALWLTLLAPIQLGAVNGIHIGTMLVFLWWFSWGMRQGLLLWGLLAGVWSLVIGQFALWLVAHGYSSWTYLLALAFIQALSHSPEPFLPPRVTGLARWMPLKIWLLGDKGQPTTLGVRAARLLGMMETSLYGMIDEAIASPRLAPIQVLEVMWLCGYAPELRGEWKSLSRRATATGNPAIDYIGEGGGTTLRWSPSSQGQPTV